MDTNGGGASRPNTMLSANESYASSLTNVEPNVERHENDAITEKPKDSSPSSSDAGADAGGVQVEAAKEEFSELRQQLSRVSTLNKSDIEKASPEDEFDLLEYLVSYILILYPSSVILSF